VSDLLPDGRWNRAWIIGASSGIGREMAIALSERCKEVLVSARSADRLAELVGGHANMVALPLDVTDRLSIGAVAARIDSDGDPLDLVVISSGTWRLVGASDLDPEAFRSAMEVNYLGAVNVIAAVAPAMMRRRRGQIAVVASVAGYRGLPNAAAYAPTKAALINLVECLRPQMRRAGVDLALVNPGFVDTPMSRVNTCPMPFLMDAGVAARRAVAGLASGRYETVFPRRLAWPMKLLRIMPNRLFFWIVDRFILKGARPS
jgi:short-subunit dehydrogenase